MAMNALQPVREWPRSSLQTPHPVRSRVAFAATSSPWPVVSARILVVTVGLPTAEIVGSGAAGVAAADLRPKENAREATVVGCDGREGREAYLSAMTVSASQASKV